MLSGLLTSVALTKDHSGAQQAATRWREQQNGGLVPSPLCCVKMDTIEIVARF